jgi:hypothetical protein
MDDHATGKWKAIFDRQHAALAEELSASVAEEIQASVAGLAAKHDAFVTDLVSQHRSAVAQLEDRHRAQAGVAVAEAAQHREAVAEIAARHEEAAAETDRQHRARMVQLESAHQARMAAFAAKHEETAAEADRQHGAQMAEIAAKHEAFTSSFTAQRDEAVAQAVQREKHIAAEQAEAARQQSRTEGREAGQREASEALNQVLRRLRQSPSEAAVLQLLVEATTTWAPGAAVFSLDEKHARSLALRGLNTEDEIDLDLDAAGAFRTVVDTKDPVTAVSSGAEVSPTLARTLAIGDEPAPKAYLFPVIARQNVVAILLAAGRVTPAPLELLCESAGMKLELLTTPVISSPKSPEFVQIAVAAVSAPSPRSSPQSWSDLSPDDQKLHLQAQRVARVRIAEVRLYQAEELRKGVFMGNIYGALQKEIDAARQEFLQSFLSKSPSMVDYLHLEMLRSLAHEDDRLLGPGYPGPMV